MRGCQVNRLVAPLSTLQEALRRISQGRSGEDWPVGYSQWEDTRELILAPASSRLDRRVRIVMTDDFDPPRWLASDCAGLLLVGRESRRGEAAGYLARTSDALEPLHSLHIVGPGMHTLHLSDRADLSEDRQIPINPDAEQRWSRTIGALGAAVWNRLVNLHLGLVGAGRTGSVLARMLLRTGTRRLTLIDPDNLEVHNLGESDDSLGQLLIGRAKVEALRAALRPLYPWSEVTAVSESITHLRSLEALKACDVLIACTDHDSARLAAACVAAMLCRPLVDVATGISRGPASRMGVSVRLILPGRCLVCAGGLRLPEAQNVLRSAAAERTFHAGRDWRRERMGSLLSLNHLASALAQRMIEDLVAERIRETTWLHLEYDQRGKAVITYPPLGPDERAAGCPLCSALAGLGDDGLPKVPDLIRTLDGQTSDLPGPRREM
jgi:molybdopterin/thiamine biosynthesis adenylyltransferase